MRIAMADGVAVSDADVQSYVYGTVHVFRLETRVRVTCRLTKKSGPESPARARRAPARGGRRAAAARGEDGV